jgi:hypothetical protein
VTAKDWLHWHDGYDDPASNLARRLAAVQERLRAIVESAPPGPIHVVSLCAGEGRDLFGALDGHPRRGDVRARLVEINPLLVARARARVNGGAVEVVEGDAGDTGAYSGAVPADVVLLCGVFGNISDADIARTVRAMPGFVVPGAHVIWTRHRREPDVVPSINAWFAEQDFELVWLSEKDAGYGVGVHRFIGVPRTLPAGQTMFTFR